MSNIIPTFFFFFTSIFVLEINHCSITCSFKTGGTQKELPLSNRPLVWCCIQSVLKKPGYSVIHDLYNASCSTIL